MSCYPVFEGLPARDTAAFHDLCDFCAEHRQQVLCALPWLAAEIAGNDGFAPMLEIVRRHGGARLHASANFHQFTARLETELSPRTHRKIVQAAGIGALIDVPSAWGVFLVLRRVAILEAMAKGAGKRAVAQQFGVSERSLRGAASGRVKRPAERFRSSSPQPDGST